MSYEKVFKLVVAGDKTVGKTALVQTFCSEKFSKDTKITIGYEVFTRGLDLKEKGSVHLKIWVLSTEARFQMLRPTYVKGADGVMFLFSITDEKSLTSFDDWLPILRTFDPDIPIVMVGTKRDLEDYRTVDKEKAMEFAESRNCFAYLETSAKEKINVELAFETITKIMWENT